jgi:predicted nucleic acid-binding protein
MSALFADTFYWIALADFTDSAHQRALTLTAERAASRIITTDEVLTEYLMFFRLRPTLSAAKQPKALRASWRIRLFA